MACNCYFCNKELKNPRDKVYTYTIDKDQLLVLCRYCYEHEDFRAKNTGFNEVETSTERNQNENQGKDPERLV